MLEDGLHEVVAVLAQSQFAADLLHHCFELAPDHVALPGFLDEDGLSVLDAFPAEFEDALGHFPAVFELDEGRHCQEEADVRLHFYDFLA